MTKVCSKCKEEKSVEEFHKNKNKLRSWCKECRKEPTKQYYRKNKQKMKEKFSIYYQNNREKKILYQKKYSEDNKEKIIISNKKRNKIYRDIRKNNIVYALRRRVSKSVYFHLKKQFSSKNNSSVSKYFSYSIQQLKEHLENQWEPWMNWENHGTYKNGGERKWHIDHIIPQSKLPYDSMEHPNFQKCWALENLRPLEAIENIRKSNK